MSSDYLDASGLTDAGLDDEFLDLDELDLPRSAEPQCDHPPVACDATCRRMHTAGEVSTGIPRTVPSPAGSTSPVPSIYAAVSTVLLAVALAALVLAVFA
ncbi:hypothetical protein SEA_PHAYONCE_38 [Mycobacterium phage Phayonce]|uniref:Uncharacterized protein n=1 Tax=Mycobacterium phage Phayonce TaxID=1647302 RepID=A0A0F6WDW5_9CAUD|nr:hypothetical protein SEA_PHAYONCE_38 [Mycobacterium phage Phayonce]AKF14398.1 hypothetical protein SEA_PHAYONCE_38 [Mycobacterium phage Phayonce]